MQTLRSYCQAVLLLLIIACPAHANEPVVLSGNPYGPPISWEANQALEGLGPELVTSILNDLSVAHSMSVFGDWKQAQQAAQRGEVDILVAAYRNKERERYLEFSKPYIKQPIVVIVEKGNEFPLKNWRSLTGKPGVAGIGESFGEDFDLFISEQLDVRFLKFERAIEQLNRGEADFLICDLYTALIYSRLLQGEEAISILDPPVSTESFHIAVRKDSPAVALLPEINKAIERRQTEGAIVDSFLAAFDSWKNVFDERNRLYRQSAEIQSAQQQEYLKYQDEMAVQRIVKTLTARENLPEIDR